MDDIKVLVAGVHTSSEAYPNTLYVLEQLRKDISPKEINTPLLPKTGGAFRFKNESPLAFIARIFSTHAAVLIRILCNQRYDFTYVPYPSTLFLFCLSFIPMTFRPRRIVADAFISIYDTIVNDRSLINEKSYLAKIIKNVEHRAFRTANAIVVDTPQNADFYASSFELPSKAFTPIPLMTNEIDYKKTPLPESQTCHVLFVGTLIPLHGIQVILNAAKILAHRKEIIFTIIGDGQEAKAVESAIASKSLNLVWKRDWMSPSQLSSYIANASICLGIFGSTAKADRVCPYKIYAYSTVGRPVITTDSSWLKAAAEDYGQMPFIGVPAGDAKKLAEKIEWLANDLEERKRAADIANRFYANKLSNNIAYSKLRACLLDNGASQ